MFAKQLMAVISAAAVLTGIASAAHAEPAKAPDVSFTTRDAFAPGAQWGVQNRKTMQWDASKGRWGLRLDMEQPARGEMALKDVRAGAYYRVTPSLRVGGAVALGNRDQVGREIDQGQPAARVRLESSLKF